MAAILQIFGLFLFIIFLIITIPDWSGWLGQLVAESWPFLLGMCLPLIFWAFWHARSAIVKTNKKIAVVKREEQAVGAIEKQAVRAAEILAHNRPVLKRKIREIEELRSTVRGEINFHLLANEHNKSRLLADEWYNHKHDAIEAKRKIVSGVNTLRRHVSGLTNVRGNLGLQRALVAKKATEARHSIEHMTNVANSVQVEIDQSGVALDRYNDETGKLRDHIGNNCGPRGRRWYDDLQERTRRRRIDNY